MLVFNCTLINIDKTFSYVFKRSAVNVDLDGTVQFRKEESESGQLNQELLPS